MLKKTIKVNVSKKIRKLQTIYGRDNTNKQKCLNFIVVPPGKKNYGQIILKRRKS